MAERIAFRPVARVVLLLALLTGAVGLVNRGEVRVTSAAPSAAPIIDNGPPDGRMAMAARIESGGLQEIEPADDFILSANNQLTSASFFGLLPSGAPVSSIQDVVVEIYRVFPKDSNTARTPQVPTRANSP